MRDALWALGVWLALTVAGELAAPRIPLPPALAAEARVVDEAFRYLVIIGMPVFTFVLTVLLYSLLRFRAVGDPPEDGPPIFGHSFGALAWVAVTSLLTLSLVIQPGLRGLQELGFMGGPSAMAADGEALVVQVEARQWSWVFTYPQYQIRVKDQLVLPLGHPVRFEITSRDVVHSFWIPAFRLKIDAVPGRTTVLILTPSQPGRTAVEPTLRLQCAELCGTGHAGMTATVEVIPADQFAAWVDQQRKR